MIETNSTKVLLTRTDCMHISNAARVAELLRQRSSHFGKTDWFDLYDQVSWYALSVYGFVRRDETTISSEFVI